MDVVLKYRSGIYKISNSINDRIYIGSAISLYNRYHCHRLDLLNNRHHSLKLQRFCNKYGFDKLKFEVVEYCEKKDLLVREQIYLDALNPFYNTAKFAGNTTGVKASIELKKRFSEMRKGKITTGMLGKNHTNETKELISKKAKQRGLHPNFIAASKKANTGKKHSKEMREKIAIKQRKLNIQQVTEIKELLAKKVKQVELAKKFNVSQRLIAMVNLGIYSVK